MLKRSKIAALFLLALLASGLDRADYHPAPGSVAETWYFEQVLHKMRHKKAVVAALRWLQSQPDSKEEFADVTVAEAELDSDFHDYTKIHQEQAFLHEQGLPEDQFIPEVFGKLVKEHVKPAPEKTKPVDPAHPTPSETFRIWIDRLNVSDENIEERTRRKYPRAKREKLAFLTLFADFADTGLMRKQEFADAQLPSVFVSNKIKAKWPRLEQIGDRQELFLKTLRHFEAPVQPNVSLYEQIMKDLTEDKKLPELRKMKVCSTCLAVPIPK